ncbi:hypothetical protein KM043_002874 [Ampulex compressa]|nr:hypothetical protein KM043_002874 [Ampulex compressa]
MDQSQRGTAMALLRITERGEDEEGASSQHGSASGRFKDPVLVCSIVEGTFRLASQKRARYRPPKQLAARPGISPMRGYHVATLILAYTAACTTSDRVTDASFVHPLHYSPLEDRAGRERFPQEREPGRAIRPSQASRPWKSRVVPPIEGTAGGNDA